MAQKITVRTRIAPSPTGENLHIGNLYTALLNWVIARKNKGRFIVRIEDTDRLRLVEGSEDRILDTLKSYGLDYDESTDKGGPFNPYRQSERLDIYRKYALELISKKAAYYCICTKERLAQLREKQLQEKIQTRYDKHCLSVQDEVLEQIKNGAPSVVRLNILPRQKMSFTDLIRGEITFSSDEVDDQVLLKSDGFPTYHLAVVIDDHLMEITHVIRAEEWISSTPKHILLYESFGWPRPLFAHTPILRNPDKSKLSKRKNPVWANWYLEEGFLPEAVLNYLALMGWSHPEQKDIFEIEEFIKEFELKNIKTVGPAFDIQKLKWMNQQYIQALTPGDLKNRLQNFYRDKISLSDDLFHKLYPLIHTRMELLKDFKDLTGFIFDPQKYPPRSSLEKEIAGYLIEQFNSEKSWSKDRILDLLKSALMHFKIKMSVLYYILTGSEKGLPLPESLEILGKDQTIHRLKLFLK